MMSANILWLVVLIALVAILAAFPANARARRTPFPTRHPTTRKPTTLKPSKAPTPQPTKSSKRLALMVPAYFYPSWNGSPWNKLTQLAEQGVNVTAVMNPANGPGPSQNSDYVTAVTAFKSKGGKLIGYVYSCYGRNQCAVQGEKRTVAQMVTQALQYDDWYGPLEGIFVDELSSSLHDFEFYQNFSLQIRAAKPEWKLVANPGIPCPEQYLQLFDTLLTREAAGSATVAATTWGQNYPADRQYYLYYAVSTTTTMITKVNEARSRNVGYVYVTNDVLPNPWDTLPPYIDDLVAEL